MSNTSVNIKNIQSIKNRIDRDYEYWIQFGQQDTKADLITFLEKLIAELKKEK